jgi:hypothetical protein
MLFILTRCSRLVASEEGSSPFGSGGGGGGGGGGSHHGGSAYMTVQPRSKGPGRLRRFSGFPMLGNRLSLDRPHGHPHLGPLGNAVSPRGGASPLLRSATAPSRSLKDLMAGMHHLRLHEGGGGGGGGGGKQPVLSPMPESPSTVRSPLASGTSEVSTPSHPTRGQVGLSPLGRSVVTALEAELEQAAAVAVQDAAAATPADRHHHQQQQQQQEAPGSNSTTSPVGTDSPSKRAGIFKLLKLRFQNLRSASKEPAPAAAATAVAAALEAAAQDVDAGSDAARESFDELMSMPTLSMAAVSVLLSRWPSTLEVTLEGTPALRAPVCALQCCVLTVSPLVLPILYRHALQAEAATEPTVIFQAHPPPPHQPAALSARGSRRTMSADTEGLRLHPGLQKALTLQVELPGSPVCGSPRRVVCRICEEAVAREGLQRHSRVCAMLEAICKQVGGSRVRWDG